MPCSWMRPVALWGSSGGGSLLYGALHDKSRKTAKGEGELSQFAEMKAIQLALDIASREKWPVLYLYTDSWMVVNALWGSMQQWKKNNWQLRGKPI